MGKVDALTKAITSLRFTCCYELWHDDKDYIFSEATRRKFGPRTREREREGPHRWNDTRTVPGLLRMQSIAQQELEASGYDAAISDRNLRRVADSAGFMLDETDEDMMKRIAFRDIVRPEMYTLWAEMKATNDEVFGDIWTFPLSARPLYGTDYDIVSKYVLNKESFIGRIAETLAPFKNLDTVGYYEPHQVSRRYENIFAINNLTKINWETKDTREEKAAYDSLQIGLDLLLRALQRGKIQPKAFALPSPAFNLECFTTTASPQLIHNALKATHQLRISQISDRHLTLMGIGDRREGLASLTRTPKNHTEICLTHDNFPLLRDLVVNMRFDMESRTPSAPTAADNSQPVSEPAHLEHLTMRYNPANTASAYLLLRKPEFINRFDLHLRHLTVVNALHGNWNALLKNLAKMLLDSLDVCVEPSVYENVWENEVEFGDNGLVCVDDLFLAAAKECTVQPEWVMDLVKDVWREQDMAVERLLEDSDEEGEFEWNVDSDGEVEATEE